MNVAERLCSVLDRIKCAATERSEPDGGGAARPLPRLVAVSKTKPAEVVVQAYQCGQRFFGENYVQELVDKANDPQVLELCPDIEWRFIGNLQRNKCARVLSVARLTCVESVDSPRLADAVQKAASRVARCSPLSVFIQVNTSREPNKGGVMPEDAGALVRHISSQCPQLRLDGLMTIGQYGRDPSQGDNPDFLALVECRRTVCAELGMSESSLELSMGMSADFEQAIRLGSTSVRVGSEIFGARQPKPAHQTV